MISKSPYTTMDHKGQILKIPPQVAEFFSPESLEVLEHFGLEAPALLNQYCCTLEDVLIETVGEREDLKEKLENKLTKTD